MSPVACRYCEAIHADEPDYGVRPARHARTSSHPRCDLHWRFVCGVCSKARHFHGTAFCPEKEAFYCLHCAPEHRAPQGAFWAWSYYYRLKCPWHEAWHPALDRLEYEGKHPWQEREGWTQERRGMSPSEEIETLWTFRVEPGESVGDEDVRRGWDAAAQWWESRYTEKGDVNREWVIDPALLRLLGEVEGLQVLDAGCGTGYLARLLARQGAEVQGVDLSPRLLEIAREAEGRGPLGIDYHEADLAALPLEDEAFDAVVSNVVLQDVRRLETALRELHRVLRPGGRFVFSVTHPCFERPVPGTWVREPEDTERVEEWRHLAVDRYYDDVALFWGPEGKPPSVGFHRPLQTYFRALHEAGFLVRRLEEPRGDAEALERHYRHFADLERVPLFLVAEAVKPSSEAGS